MDKYLKMSDWFSGMTESQIADYVYDGGIGYGESEAAAHAINSHDELVVEVERLRGIINRVISTSKELSLRSPSTQWGDGYKECALATAHALEDMLK